LRDARRSVRAAKRRRSSSSGLILLPGECLGAAKLVFEVGQLGGGDGERSA
jgi:hypothetical protein